MATIEVFRTEKMIELENSVVVGASLDSNGNLTLALHDGSTIAVGNVKGPPGDAGTFPPADELNFGLALLATSEDVADGTDTSKAVTPAALKPNLPTPPLLARVGKNVAVSTNIPNPITFTAITFDPDGLWDASNNWFTAPISGYYDLNAQLRQSTTSNFTIEAYTAPSGSTSPAPNEYATGSQAKGAANGASYLNCQVPLNAGDHVQLKLRGAAMTNTATDLDNFFEISYVRPL